MNPKPTLIVAALAAVLAQPIYAAPAPLFNVLPAVETPNVASPGDADDPAFWLHPTDLGKSLIITAVKNGGGRVYDLAGNLVQVLPPFTVTSGASRFNNIDVQYGFRLYDGSRVDIAVASDRGQDIFRIWKIDAGTPNPLNYIGAATPTRAFADKPDGSPNPVSQQNTAYGMTLYRDLAADRMFVLATQRSQPRIAQFELLALADGTVDVQYLRDWQFPSLTVGSTTYNLAGKQFEGMVVDQQTGILYAGQEDVGIWRVDLKTGLADASPFVLSTDYDPMSPLTQDIEGLTLYYGRNGTGYLIASSQGDNTFAVFDRQTLAYLGSFQVGAQGGIDAVEHSDGADVVGLALPGYPSGLFVTQDGENAPEGGTNFKYVPWQNIAGAMNLQIDPLAYDPRTLAPVPEPETWAMLLAGLGLVGWMARRRSV
jgi:3-phytase